MDLKTYAAREGISVQRASQLARSGRITAHKTAGRWVVEQPTARRARPGRAYSQNTRDDVVAYLHRRTLEVAPPGYRRGRLAARIRELRTADNPARYLRDMFTGAPVPEGPGGAAIVRAALRGLDDQVRFVLSRTDRIVLRGPREVAVAFRDARMIVGLSDADVAAAIHVPVADIQFLERSGRVRTDNRAALKALTAVGVSPAKISTRSS